MSIRIAAPVSRRYTSKTTGRESRTTRCRISSTVLRRRALAVAQRQARASDSRSSSGTRESRGARYCKRLNAAFTPVHISHNRSFERHACLQTPFASVAIASTSEASGVGRGAFPRISMGPSKTSCAWEAVERPSPGGRALAPISSLPTKSEFHVTSTISALRRDQLLQLSPPAALGVDAAIIYMLDIIIDLSIGDRAYVYRADTKSSAQPQLKP